MAIKEVKRAYTEYEYVWKGNCPICGKEQTGENEVYADRVCTGCLVEKVLEKINNSDDDIIGGIVINHEGNSHDHNIVTVLGKDLQVREFYTDYIIVPISSDNVISDITGYEKLKTDKEKLELYMGSKYSLKHKKELFYEKIFNNIISKLNKL